MGDPKGWDVCSRLGFRNQAWGPTRTTLLRLSTHKADAEATSRISDSGTVM